MMSSSIISADPEKNSSSNHLNKTFNDKSKKKNELLKYVNNDFRTTVFGGCLPETRTLKKQWSLTRELWNSI